MNKYQELSLSKDATQYIRDYLSDGNKLAQVLLQELSLNAGECTSYLPADTESVNIKEFRYGNVASAEESERCLVRVIQNYLQTTVNGVVMCENALARRGDAILESMAGHLIFFEQEVYHVIGGEELSEIYVQRAIRQATSAYRFLAVMTVNPFNNKLKMPLHLTLNELRRAAQNANQMVVGAFDGEGYVIWSKRQRSSS